jgi:pSer/pThr/pTyr-binding forkhead associated (FHA) protein
VPELVLTSLKVLFLVLLYLFIARAIRVIWLDLVGPRAPKPRPVRQPRPQTASKPSKRPAAKAPRSLVVTEDGQNPRTVGIDGEKAITFGRAEECTVVLKDTYVSQMHTRIFSKDGAWYVEDLGSTNGTYLNRAKVTDASPLTAGDEVRLGKTTVELRR